MLYTNVFKAHDHNKYVVNWNFEKKSFSNGSFKIFWDYFW
jgi:hypothetical protein